MKANIPKEQRAAGTRGSGIPHQVDVRVGEAIRARRLILGMNQETLAKAVGLTFQQIQKYEGGANRVSASRLKQFADYLGVSVGYFFMSGPIETRPEALELMYCYAAMTPSLRSAFIFMARQIAEEKANGAHHQPQTTPRPAAGRYSRRKTGAPAPKHARA